MTEDKNKYILSINGMSKSFGRNKVLKHISMNVKPGTIMGLMGENGAGKSTMMKCLFGTYQKDEGTIVLDGKEVNFSGPKDALENGVAMVHQELNQCLERSVVDNMFLGRYPKNSLGVVDEGRMKKETSDLFRKLGITVDLTQPMKKMSVSQRQMCEIAKAISYHSKVIVLDEPTSSLTAPEVEKLFKMMRQLKAQGISLIYISHKMDEIFEICDEISVLRDGSLVMTKASTETDMNELIAAMVGRSLDNRFPPVDNTPGETILSVQNISTKYAPKLQNISFDIRKGEIFGFYGLVGAGRTELLETIFGIRTRAEGNIVYDGKVLNFSSPKDAMASVSFWFILLGVLAMLIYAAILYGIFYTVLIREKTPLKIPYQRQYVSLVLLLLTAALFIPIRGGFSVSTMNLSKVYYSQNQRMNHAAINPAFSFMYSATHQNNFDKQYRFMDPKVADDLFAEMLDKPVTATDSIPQILNTQRPNIIFIILESFSTHLMETMGGQPNVAVNMDKFGKEGVLFTNFYANSFRTDRGLASIISGYPGQPSTSIMKYPEKTDGLPSIPRSLKDAGYSLEYYYGGDADFTNMRSYLVSSGIEKIISETDFPLSERPGKWGAPDHALFQRFMKDLKEEKQQEPFFKIIQTSSSHEPFEVPFYRLDDKVLNAFAYADSCVGDFVKQYKATPGKIR